MNYQRPDRCDRLAAAYVLGTLHGGARARFAQLLREHAPLQARVAFWQQQLTPLAQALPPVAPSAAVWQAIAARLAPPPPVHQAATSWWARWLDMRTLGTLTAGLMLGLTLTLSGTALLKRDAVDSAANANADTSQLPQSYVGVLAAADGRTGVIVSSLRHGKVMDVKQVQPVSLAAGQTLYLWAIQADGKTRPIGPVPPGKFVQVVLADTSEKLFASATELALSIEAEAATPLRPSTAFVYRGLCGKLWRLPAPTPAAPTPAAPTSPVPSKK
jgi:anti-sigma-K factor RskA